MASQERMTPQELRASVGLAGIFGLRMLGMFIILPVFALYAQHLPGGSSHALVGLALGAYGLTQACLQVPFGWLSDRWGRKRTIYFGLAIFAFGSFVAAAGTDIYIVILGRVIQGAGAISAAVIALTADLTRDGQRTKAMAIIGITIGATFALSMVAGPVLNRAIGVPGIFAMTGVLAAAAILVVRFAIPDPPAAVPGSASPPYPVRAILADRQLMRLNFGIFALHAVLMALFVVVPLALQEHLAAAEHWRVYLPVMLISIALMMPPMMLMERSGLQKPVFLAAIGVLTCAGLLLAMLGDQLYGIAIGLLVFFTAFNLLEATLPSLISRVAPAGAKGTAIGVYGTVQFAGTFCGATAGGMLAQYVGMGAVFAFCAVLGVLWFGFGVGMRIPAVLDTRRYRLPDMDSQAASRLVRKLSGLPGVREAILSADGVAHLKVDSRGFDEQNVVKLLAGEG